MSFHGCERDPELARHSREHAACIENVDLLVEKAAWSQGSASTAGSACGLHTESLHSQDIHLGWSPRCRFLRHALYGPSGTLSAPHLVLYW